MLNSFLHNYFGFNKQQRNGLLVLVLISFLLLLIRLIYPSFIQPDPIIVQNLPLMERKLDSSYSAFGHFTKNNLQNESKHLNLFVFDPNSVSYEQLLQLGFKEKTAQVFLRFRNKGFHFKQKKDLQKVYGISEKFYSKLEPYILIEPAPEIKQKEPSPDKDRTPVVSSNNQIPAKIELNSADSITLTGINGIGPSYAKRILKYRSILGGFANVEQLKEVYGFTEELFEKIKTSVYVDPSSIKKIDLNKDDFKTVNKHPYLSYEVTKTLFDWRRKTTINAINLKDILNDPVLYRKLLPYLIFQ